MTASPSERDEGGEADDGQWMEDVGGRGDRWDEREVSP